MSKNTDIKKILKIIEPYCHKVVQGGKHIKAFPIKGNEMITISLTSTDFRKYQAVRRDFRRCGIELPLNF